MLYGGKGRRVAPNVIVSDTLVLDGTTATTVKKSAVAIKACLVYAIIIENYDDITADTELSVENGTASSSTELLTILINKTADTPFQTVLAFPAPIYVSSGLVFQHTADSDVDYRVLYVPLLHD